MAPEYEPNKEGLMRNLGKVALFGKMQNRKPIFDLKDVPEGYEVNFSAIKARYGAGSTRMVDFGKKPARKREAESPLPCFMHASYSRLALTSQTHKTFQMNCTNESFLDHSTLSLG